jgi:hypothetical protein
VEAREMTCQKRKEIFQKCHPRKGKYFKIFKKSSENILRYTYVKQPTDITHPGSRVYKILNKYNKIYGLPEEKQIFLLRKFFSKLSILDLIKVCTYDLEDGNLTYYIQDVSLVSFMKDLAYYTEDLNKILFLKAYGELIYIPEAEFNVEVRKNLNKHPIGAFY